MKDFFKKNIGIILILIIAAFIRLYRIADYMTFLGDEGRDVLVVYNILHGKFTLLGPTASVGGFFFGPIYYYFMAPFLWLFHYNPVGPAVMVALFGTLTVYFVYKIGSDFFSKPVGIIASLLYTLSPVVIAYSRSSWNPNLLPPFTIGTLYLLYKGLTQRKESTKKIAGISMRSLFLIGSGLCFGIELQLHYVSLFIAGVVGFFTLIFLSQQSGQLKEKLYALVQIVSNFVIGFLVGFSAMLAFELRHDFANTRHIIMFIFGSKETGAGIQFIPTVSDVFTRSFARLVAQMPNLPDGMPILEQKQILHTWESTIGAVGLVIFMFFCWQLYRMRSKKEVFFKYLLIALWFIIPVLVFGFYKKAIYDYYFQIFFPVPFWMTSLFIVWLWEKQKIVGKVVASVSMIFLLTVNLLGVPFRFPANRQLLQTEIIARAIFDQAGGKPFNFALVTGGNSDHAYRYFFTIWGNPPVAIQNTVIDPTRTSVTKQLLVVCESIPCQPEGNPLWEIAGFGRAKIVWMQHVSVVDEYRLIHYVGK